MIISGALAGLGGAIAEKAGIVSLGLEGYMTIGAFAGVVGTIQTGNPIIGLLYAAVSGGLVAGVGINILTPGLVTVLMVGLWKNKGNSPAVQPLKNIDAKSIEGIPILGELITANNFLFPMLLVIMIVSWIVIYKTPIGLRLRATGESSKVIDSLGLGSEKIRYVAVLISGVLSGIGGAYLSIGQLGFYSKGMVAGRGFIAVAALVFARMNPIGCFFTALLFGFTDAIKLRMHNLPIPSQFIQMIPYITTIVILAIVGYRKKKNSFVK